MSSQPETTPIRIVIADDHKLFREGLHALLDLEPRVQVVGEARDGDEAVLLARSLVPDIILMDVDMPGSDGIMAVTLIKEMNVNLRVLMLSFYEDDAHVLSAMKAGASGYIVKRVGMTDLLMIFEAVIKDESIVSPYLANVILQERQKKSRSHCVRDFSLTERELKVLNLIVKGYSNKEISNTVYISQDTVKVHLKHIFEKMEVDCRTKAAVKALQHQIVTEFVE